MRHTASAASCLALVVALSGCGGMSLYDVTRSPVEDCDITPSGEFCSEGGPDIQERFAVEIRDDGYTIVYFGDEAWVAEGTEGTREVLKEEKATRLPGPCTSTLRRSLSFDVLGPSLNGSYEESTRIEGPEACGDTPRGTRKSYTLTGVQTNSI